MAQDIFFTIIHAQSAYARVIDNDELEKWPDFFTEDCVYKITTAANFAKGYEVGVVYANSRGMVRDRVSALRDANIYEKQSYRHILGMPVIMSDDAKGVRTETSFIVVRIMRDGVNDLYASGRYFDLYRRQAESVKLAERIVVCDSQRFDTLLALPL
ncbi:MAG: nuclear transport factor 2 family protein [Beijerinckiaceae bacterium]|jgi:anthranilate 1,2-dioxygenase small subunit|nr:nuclear transport factor 2 family protein [Beijerinckiaceae bacterium]